jgi:hypothetical protein
MQTLNEQIDAKIAELQADIAKLESVRDALAGFGFLDAPVKNGEAEPRIKVPARAVSHPLMQPRPISSTVEVDERVLTILRNLVSTLPGDFDKNTIYRKSNSVVTVDQIHHGLKVLLNSGEISVVRNGAGMRATLYCKTTVSPARTEAKPSNGDTFPRPPAGAGTAAEDGADDDGTTVGGLPVRKVSTESAGIDNSLPSAHS